jgi:hypothetical protein
MSLKQARKTPRKTMTIEATDLVPLNQPAVARSVQEIARAILATQHPVDHPVVTRCTHSSPRLSSFAEGSPYLFPENLELFHRAIRDDISLMNLEPAKKIFRDLDPVETYPVPESCTPYIDANSLGYYLKPLLPLVFVRTKKGEPLLDARVALKYLRENSACFKSVLETIEQHAQRIFRSEICDQLRPYPPWLFSDIIQPYSAFTDVHLALRAGLWVHTPPGVSTVIGPLINQTSPLSVLTGAIETEWHHFELFVVIEIPQFDGQVLLIEPNTPIAQLFFVARAAHESVEVRFSPDHPGAEPQYWAGWEELGTRLVREGKGMVVERHGVASVQIACPHCYVSVTAAAEYGVPEDHVMRRGFNPAYKILKHEYHVGGAENRKRCPYTKGE